MSGTKRQRDKKNNYRPKAGEMGYMPSIQRNSYGKKKAPIVSEKQLKLI